MKGYQLGFISDEAIYAHVSETVKAYRRSISLADFNSNVVDPIKLTFDAKIYGKSWYEVVNDECLRQIDKSNSNKIGYFHQNIFKCAGNNWAVPTVGFDVENLDRHIFAEVKNKHNTMNSSSAQKTYIRMQSKLLEDDMATCYLVEVIAKHSKDEPWKISVDGKMRSHRSIRRISMDKFYEIVFGDAGAFYKLCNALPTIIDDVLADNEGLRLDNEVFDELSKLSPDILKSLYLLAFSTYEGFKEGV